MKPIMCAVGTSGTHANANHQRLPNAYETASWWSRLLFTWPYPLLQLGLQRPLQDADLPELQDVDRSVNCRHYFERIWELKQVRKDNHHSLQRAILFDFWKTVWYAHPIMCVAAIAKVTQAVVLGKLVQSFQQETTTTTTSGYVWAGALVVCGLITLLEHHHLFFWTWRYGMQIRTSVVATIYQKSTRLHSVFSTHDVPYGKIMNLASNDSERFLMAALFCNYIIWAPIQSIAILIVGVFTIGYAFAVGFGILLGIFIPLQVYLGGRFAYHRSKIAASTDARVQFVGQAIRGARLMKMSGYEHLFWKRIMELRKIETAKIRRANTLKSYNEALFFATNVVISIIIFIVHVKVAGRELQSGDVFTVFTLINILQMEMTKHVSLAVMAVSECYVSIARIQKFLELPELDQKQQQYAYCQENNNNEDGNSDNGHPRNSSSLPNGACLVMEHVTCYWNNVEKSATTRTSKSIQIHPEDSVSSIGDGEKSKSNDDDEELSTASSMTAATNVVALQDVTVDFQPRQLTAIVGTVGGGKSALLQALVGELPVTSGRIVRNRSLAYAAQDSWIMDGTVRDNILMGLEYNQTWYYEVVTACGLLVDFAQFSRSDQTILGDRGVQCSGGQKARIALARAIYRDADILVVDDPLSAVDAKVGRQLYEQALQRLGVQRGKCVIVATHQHQYLRNDENARCVLVENGGKVTCIGSYEECIETSKGTLIAHQSADDIVDGLVATEEENDAIFAAVLKAEDVCLDEDGFDEDDPDKQNDRPCNKDKEDHREMKQEGKVEMDTYKNYLGAMGGLWIGVFLALLFSITQGSVLVTIAIVGRWAQRPVEDQDDWDMIGLVMGLGCLVIVLALFRALICFHFTIKASQTLHDRMTKAILRAKIQFFDTNPLGRILNRFSADVGITDDMLPPTLFDFFMLSFMVLGAVATTVSTLPFVLIALPFLAWYFISVRSTFVTSSRELKRLEGLCRSPIFAMLSESLGGIATIRSNESVKFFRSKFEQVHDKHTRTFFSFIAASRWVGFRMDSLVFLLLSVVSFLSVLFNEQGWFDVDPAILGLSLSMLLQLAGLFQWCIRQSAEVVNQMVSVERVLQFSNVESEAPLQQDIDKELLERGWPEKGSVTFDEISVRYRASLPLALQKISFTIPQGARVGIVGRTGSGKTTVVQTLFRLLEAEHGRIEIDGVDVSRMGLHALRTKISVIPQIPTLYSGCSVRENLDLFGLHDDDSIRKAIQDCHLTQMIDDLPNGLDSPVSEGGSNFSVGQRQLLCLARAILSRNRILVLDEATASTDRRTDQLLQKALHESFHDGTILAVAHRLDTIIEYDYVMVLGGGKVLEFGSPAELIESGGAFASMVDDTGDAMSSDLKRRAMSKKLVVFSKT